MESNSFYDHESLLQLGFASVGKNVLVSKFARFYGIQNISIGDNVRIDDFCILSGKITLGNYIHISAYCALYGSHGIVMRDFSGLSPKSTVFSATDDFSGDYLIGPMVDAEFTNVTGGTVEIGKYVQIGANSVVFPNLSIGEGSSVGSLSLVNKTLEPWGIYAGIPAKFIKPRSKKIIELETRFR